MDSTPRISVIIPVYKVEKYLATCVDSVLRQSFQDFEIILVDDGSPDSCPTICDRYAEGDSRIRVIHKENAGLGMARNSGLDVARGEYVCFIDSDDYIAPNTLEYCHSVAEKEDADQVRFLFDRFSDSDDINSEMSATDEGYVVGIGDGKLQPIINIISPLLDRQTFFAPSTASSCTALYRRSVIERNSIRFLSERQMMSEDYIFNVDIGAVCEKIVYTSNKFYHYRYNHHSLSRTVRYDRIERSAAFSKFYAGKLRQCGYDAAEADVIAMGYTIGEMRSFNLLLFTSDLSHKMKKEAFLKVLDNEYVSRIINEYPVDKLPAIQRIAFTLHTKRKYWPSYLITRLRYMLT